MAGGSRSMYLACRMWVYNNRTSDIAYGTYTMQLPTNDSSEYYFMPKIKIENNNILFTFNPLSSYLNIGTYEIDRNYLIMTTNDNQKTYRFKIKDGDLIFHEKGSSEVQGPNTELMPSVQNKAKFVKDRE